MDEQSIMAVVGRKGIGRMVEAFYRRVKDDDLLGPMYPEDDLVGAEERLRDFLLFRLAGDSAYLEKRGHPRLRMRHAGFAIGEPEADRWVELMDGAMDEVNVPRVARGELSAFFRQVADFMRNR